MKYFQLDAKRDEKTPDFACYQMDLTGPVNAAIKAKEITDEELINLPSWSKVAANPIRAKGFITRMYASLFLQQGDHEELHVDWQVGEVPKQRVAMMFLTANNAQLEMISDYAKEILPGYEVIMLNGAARHNGQKVSNRNAEQFVKEVISLGKPTLILASMMAQRSFSIPEITELYLAYDGGQVGTTIQKMSRTLTPAEVDKVGRIFSLSFDPNRDDKFDSMILETAINYKKRNKVRSLRDAMKEVLRTIDIFSCQADGPVRMDVDSYLESAMGFNRISRVIGKLVNLSNLTTAAITALANGNTDYFRTAKKDAAQKGKTRPAKPKQVKGAKKVKNADLDNARKAIVHIVENIEVIMLSGESEYLVDAIAELDNEIDRAWVLAEFGVDLDVIYYLFEEEIIKQDWVELMVEKG